MLRNARSAAVIVASCAGLVHLLTLNRYGFYVDELYFIACAKHLAWGFADLPPFMPAIAAVARAFDDSLFALRIVPALAAVATVLVAAAIARELGASRFGVTLTAIAVALMPASLFLGNTLTTTSLEPLTWSLVAYFALRLSREPRAAWWVALVLTVGIAAYMKYSIFLPLGACAIGALLLRDRRSATLFAAAIPASALLLAPNVVWQAVHGFPMLAVLHGEIIERRPFNAGPQYEFSGMLANAPAFLAEQFAFTNPIASPVWLAGLVLLFRNSELRFARFIAVTYVTLLLIALAFSAKGYYIIGIYPALFAAGSVAVERCASRTVRAIAFAAVAVSGVLLMPIALPVLPVQGLISYMHRFGAPPHLMQPLFADEFGWDALAARVAAQYAALPAPIRSQTPIFSDSYGVAAALAYYGPRYGLPPPIGGQDQYYLWGTRGYDLSRMLAVGATEYATLKTVYRNVRMVGTFSDEYRWVLEGPTPIYLCTDPLVSPAEIWLRLRWYG